jgi:hypothetical protein
MDTEPGQLGPQEPFTDEERRRLRKLLVDDDRATWARKQIRIFTPWLIALAGGVYAFADWIQKHWKWS